MNRNASTVTVDGRALVTALTVADSFWARFRGLMLRRKLSAGSGLLIRPCKSIHMMFMRFAIDAVFIDADSRVTAVGRNVRPWIGFASGGRGARAVLELPSGAAAGVSVGQRLEFR